MPGPLEVTSVLLLCCHSRLPNFMPAGECLLSVTIVQKHIHLGTSNPERVGLHHNPSTEEAEAE